MTLSLFDRPVAPSPWLDDLFPEEDPDGLRYYQREARKRIDEALARDRSTLLVMGTGLGKTQVFASVIKAHQGPTLVLAHRDELVIQARHRIEQMTGGMVEIEQGEWRSSPRANIVVGSVQSFNQERLDRLGKHRFRLIVGDEAHIFLAPTYRRALEWFEDASVLGVTATPDRGDEKALGQVFDSVAYVFDIEDGVNSGYLVPIRGRQVVLADIQLDRVEAGRGTHGKDLLSASLDEEMIKVVGGVVAETLRLEPGRQGIAFFPGIRSAELAAHRFNALLPGSARFLCGATHPDERRQVIDDFRAGRFRYLCNVQIATEGFDCPPVSLIIQARPTLSRARYAQTVGRGTRVLPGVVDNYPHEGEADLRKAAIAASDKKDLVVLDFVGNSSKHSLVGLEDMLGGNYTESEVKEAKKHLGEGTRDPQKALLEARRQMADAAKAKVRVKANVRDFDPFHVFELGDEQRYAHRFGEKPASEAQVAVLQKLGVPDEELRDLSKVAAGKLLKVCAERRRKGLCTYRQLRQLKRFGVTETNIPFAKASDALTYISIQKWKNVDPLKLNNILYQLRQPGED